MKWRTMKIAAMLALAGGAIWQNGCGSSGVNQVVVTISPPTATVIANTVQTFSATVTGSTTLTSTWTCSYVYTPNPTTQNPNPAQVGPINNCTSGQKVSALGGGSLGTWTSTPSATNNVLTYTAPTLSNFPNPIPTITFTAAATANTSKKGTAVVTLDTGIRTAITPATATVPTEITPAQQVQFTANFLNTSPANANPQWLVTQPVSGNTTKFPQGTTPVPQDVTCSPNCGSISAQGVFTAPATQPTNTSPVGAGSQASSLAPIVYVVCWSSSDINHYAVATITLVPASQNPVTFTGIQPTTIPAGGVLQDVWLTAHNLLNTSQITFTPPGANQQPQVIPQTNVFTVPISSAYCTPSATGATTTVSCDASIMTRVRLTQTQLANVGTGTITVNNIPDASTGGTQSISFPINLVYANPQVVSAVPDSFPQGTGTDFSADGGYFGLGTSPLVQLLFNGQANVNVGTGNPRQITGFLPGSNGSLNGPGLYPVSVVSSAPLGSVSHPVVSTDVAVQPTFQSGSSSLNSIYFQPGTSTIPPQQIAYPPSINFPAVGGTANGAPSSIAMDSAKGYAAVTLQAANAVQIINLVANPNAHGRFMPQMGGQIPVGNQPTSIAIDDQINLTNYPGQDLGVVVNSADYTLTLMALPSGSIIGSPISLKGLISGGPTNLASPMPYAVGVDPTTHYGVVAFSNAFIGFVVDVNPNTSSTPPTCFVSSQTPPCALTSVSMNTGATPQVVMQPGVPVAYVMPGGTGVMSVVNLLATNNTVTIAAAPNGVVCTNDIVTVTTPTINGLNPSSPGSVLISGVSPASYNGTYNVLSVPTSFTFTYEYNGTSCPSTSTGGGGTVTYGNPYYTFGTSPTIVGAAVNPVTKYLSFADPGAATAAPQIGFVSGMDQSVSSLYLTRGSCVNCTPIPSGAPEVGLRWVSWDPYRNIMVAFNPSDNYNEISLISPPTTATGGETTIATRLIQAIATGDSSCATASSNPPTVPTPVCYNWAPAQGSFTPAGGSAAVTVYGPMVYDPITNLVLAANAGTNAAGFNTLNYVDIDPGTTFKPVNIENIIVTSGGVANAQPPLSSAPNAPTPLPKAVCDPSSPTNIYATCFPQAVTVGQSATLRILGQGFTTAGTPVVRLDTDSTGVTITSSSNTELDVTIAASRLAQAHDFALDVVTANGIGSNTQDLYAIGVISLSSLCTSAVMPEAVAMDEIANVAVITSYGCNTASFINMDSTNAHNYGVPYGALLATVNVGNHPIGVDVIPRLGYAVVANNADASASIIQYGGSPFTATQLAPLSNSCPSGVATTNICTGLSPVGVAIDQDRGLALVANSGGNSLSAIDLTPLLHQTASGCQAPNGTTDCIPVAQLVPTSGPPTAIAVDPNRDEAVVTNIQNAGTTSITGGLDVINLSTNPPTKTTTASINSLTANPTGIVYDPAATSGSCSTPCTSSALIYVSSTQQNAIYTFDPDSSATSLIRVGVNPFSLGYNYQTGALVTTNSTANTLSVVDAVNAPTFLTRETLGISSQSQFALAIDNFTNTAVMVDQNNDRVLLIPVQ
ncbi:MAG TPA: hypothetical protein VMU53_18470 [Candidatus Sulfotelmatobacter sp.]|nr:hypothetical protein [Candidatus Sulfotelmatobacter sp.]